MYRPYEHQQDLIERTYQAFKSGKRSVVMQSGTGSGKTVCFSWLKKAFSDANYPTLTLTHRKELIDQAAEKSYEITGIESGIIKSNVAEQPHLINQIASVQTLFRLPRNDMPPAKLVIVDECHRAPSETFSSILECYPEAYVLGATATPLRLDGIPLANYFESIEIGVETQWLINEGYLAPYNLVLPDSQKADINGHPVKAYCEFAYGKQFIVSNRYIPDSIEVEHLFNASGIPVAHIDGKTHPLKRQQIFEAFKERRILGITQCGIANEGLDLPSCKCIIDLHKTKSLTYWLQLLGRSLRPYKEMEASIIALTSNWKKLGLPADAYDWEAAFYQGKKAKIRKKAHSGQREYTEYNSSINLNAELEEYRMFITQEQKEFLDNIVKLFGTNTDEAAYKLFSHAEIRNLTYGGWRYLANKLNFKDDWALSAYHLVQNESDRIRLIRKFSDKFKNVIANKNE